MLQYIREARKAGLKDAQIQQNAVTAGWPAAVVTTAIGETAKASRPAGTEAGNTPSTTPKQPQAAVAPPREMPAAAGANPASPSGSVPAAKPANTAGAEAATGIKQANTAGGEPPAKTGNGAGVEPGAAVKAANTASGEPAAKTANPAGAEPGAPAKTPATLDRGVPENYQIGAGDVLQISVWKEPDASVPSVVVRPDGRITMPMLKEVPVIGMTPAEAEKAITDKLVNFISAADVTVIVKEINSKKVYVVGAVKKEGPISYTYRMTILQALSEAGGLTDYAKKKKIYVLRHEGGRDYQLPFDYDAALRGERMELNIPLMPGDTLVVPK